MTYPQGWYFAAFGEDLRRGEVRAVEFMNRRWALFRARSGRVGMVDAQCCHMGADLGRSGAVVGEHLQCGYHAWEFDAGGRCARMPRVDRIPARARQASVPVVERLGNLWFWHGPDAPAPFPDVAALESDRFVRRRGERHVAVGGPRATMEHIADVYHFYHNHQAPCEVEYRILRDEGAHFEYQLRPVGIADDAPAVQRWFRPYGFIEFAGPCAGIYRTQAGPTIDRDGPLLAIVLSVTPIRGDETLFTWRICARKVGPDFPLWPINRLVAAVLWRVIYRNNHRDLEVLRWLRSPEHPVWVKADGESVRRYRAFYDRNVPGPRRVADEASPPNPEVRSATVN